MVCVFTVWEGVAPGRPCMSLYIELLGGGSIYDCVEAVALKAYARNGSLWSF